MESKPNNNNIIMVTSAQDKWAKPEDWARFQGTITDLYMSQSLPNVIRIMREEHNFHATKKRPRSEAEAESDLSSPRHRPLTQDDGYNAVYVSIGDEPDAGMQPLGPPQLSRVGFGAPSGSQRRFEKSASEVHHYELGTGSRAVLTAQTGLPNADAPHSSVRADPISTRRHHPITIALTSDPKPSLEHQKENNTQQTTGEGLDDVSVISSSGSWMTTVMLRSSPTSTSPPPAQLLRLARQPSRHRPRSLQSTISGQTKHSSISTGASASRSKAPKSDSGSSRSSRWSKSSRASVTMMLPPGALRRLESPDAFMLPEKSMFYARHYISSTFTTGLWGQTQSTEPELMDTECIKLDAWFNDFNPGLDFLHQQLPKKAYRVFRRCFLTTRDVIEPQDPRVVIYIVQQAIRFMFWDTAGKTLAGSLLRCATLLCRDLFTAQHPLFIFLSQLARMSSFDFALNIRTMMDYYFDHLEPFIDETSESFRFINDLRGLTVSLMEGTHIMAIHEAKPTLEGLVARAAKHSHSSLHLRIEIAAALQRNLFCNEARTMLEAIRASPEAQSNHYELVYAGFILMVTLRRMQDLSAAIDVGYAQSTRHSSLLLALGKLEADLHSADRINEANQVHVQLERAMREEYGVEEETSSDPQSDIAALG
ncbi:hypothetical protein BX600DRAFT_519546 [Xylariales sp. PMI_506]|nr:hypothetical protein BX600DRAFT_519546 [Xylariales sp. PMI_506]